MQQLWTLWQLVGLPALRMSGWCHWFSMCAGQRFTDVMICLLFSYAELCASTSYARVVKKTSICMYMVCSWRLGVCAGRCTISCCMHATSFRLCTHAEPTCATGCTEVLNMACCQNMAALLAIEQTLSRMGCQRVTCIVCIRLWMVC
jgi:hypothetical protein